MFDGAMQAETWVVKPLGEVFLIDYVVKAIHCTVWGGIHLLSKPIDPLRHFQQNLMEHYLSIDQSLIRETVLSYCRAFILFKTNIIWLWQV